VKRNSISDIDDNAKWVEYCLNMDACEDLNCELLKLSKLT